MVVRDTLQTKYGKLPYRGWDQNVKCIRLINGIILGV